jgi:prepilin-type N-terminal cleavage/methylation domain-containing protein
MKKIIKNKKGFTLLEIIISIALIGIIAVALLTGISYSTRVLFSSGQFMDKNYQLQVDLENFISGDVDDDAYASLTEELIFDITWTGTVLEDFEVTGKSMHMSSDSLVQNETFYVFYSQGITKSNPK